MSRAQVHTPGMLTKRRKAQGAAASAQAAAALAPVSPSAANGGTTQPAERGTPDGEGVGRQLAPAGCLPFPLPPAFLAEVQARFADAALFCAELEAGGGGEARACWWNTEQFASTTFPAIAAAAASLGELGGPLTLQTAGTDSTLTLPRATVRGLLGAMALGVPPPLQGERTDDGEMLAPRDLRHLFTAGTPLSEQALRGVLGYFEAAPSAAAAEATPVQIRRCVLAKEVDFAARSPRCARTPHAPNTDTAG